MDSDTLVWVWQQPDWPRFHWQEERVQPLLRNVLLKQGILVGKAGAMTAQFSLESRLDTLLQNIITSSAIEGENVHAQSVRSSLAKRIGLNVKQPYPTSERSEGLAKMMLDATTNLEEQLTQARLLQWHQWLFPHRESSLYDVRVGELRGEEPMQVVSGRIDKPTVHFEAPPRHQLENELTAFIHWFNQSRKEPTCDPLLRAGICHFWFVTIHPFDDGNGRITRVLTDLALAQGDQQSIRLYTMSAAILAKRRDYYHVLEKSQHNTTDITVWLMWFLQTLEESLQFATDKIELTLTKAKFWHRNQQVVLCAEQIKILNRLLDGGEKGFEQGISSAQYQKVARVSKATATRHLTDLLAKGCVVKLPGGGRNTRYRVQYPAEK